MAGQYELGDLGGVLGSDLYNSLFSSQGFSGYDGGASGGAGGDNPWMEQLGWNADGLANWGTNPNEDAMSAFDGYSFNWNPTGGQGGLLTGFDSSGKEFGKFEQEDEDGFTQLMGMVAPAVASWGFGGALSGMFGGGMTGGALGHGLSSGTMTSMQGGDFGKGFLSGAVGGGLNGLAQGTPAVMGNNPSAYVPATPGTSIAGSLGVTNPLASGMINRGGGSFLGSLAGGKSGSEALKSGLIGAGLSGINSVGKSMMTPYMDSLKGWLGGPGSVASAGADSEFDSLMGSGGDMSDQTDVSPNRYAEMVTGSDGMETFNPDYGFGGGLNSFSSGLSPDQSVQSANSGFSLPSIFGDAGRSVGNFALNNAGDLASMLYGFYNNRKQQKALGQQAASLQSLYGQNSPYAQQLRAKLNAQAAATGRRSNVAGRETQLQAMLADRNAQMSPHLMQLNQARGKLMSSNMNDILKFAKGSGLIDLAGKGLQGLFSNNTYNGGGYNMTGVQNPYGSDVVFNGWQ